MKPIYLETTGIYTTLTTWIYCNMWQLYAAENVGLSGYINWPKDRNRALRPYWDDAKFAQKPNMYDWYFEQPLFETPPPRAKWWTFEAEHHEMGKYNLMSQPLSTIKAFYRKNCRLNKDVIARGEAIKVKYGIDFDKTIGITWRGTDCVTDGRPYMPIETYFPYIDDILEKEPNLRIMCTAEETEILNPLLAKYPQAFTIDEFYSSPKGHPQNPECISPLSGYERGMQPALMVWLFSQCKHYIKNRSSTGSVASWLSTGRIVCLAHPENLGYGFDITKAEINGEIVPLIR